MFGDFMECNITSSHLVLLHKKDSSAGDSGSFPYRFLAKAAGGFLGMGAVHGV